MSTITLSANDTRAIPLGGYLRVDAFAVGASATPVRVSVHGDGIQANTASDSCVFLMSCPQRASIIVAPVGGGEFGPDQSVRVTITRSGASDHQNMTLEFPIVRVDGVSEKIVGDIVNMDGQNQITAYGSDESTNLGHESMVVLGSLRSRLGATTGVSRLIIHADTSATAARLSDERILAGAGHLIVGTATALGIDDIRIGDRPSTADRVSTELQEAIAAGADRIGPGTEPTAGTDTLVVHLTPAPRSSMLSTGHPSLIVAYGPTAAAEKNLFSRHSPKSDRTGFLILNEALLDALDRGDAHGFSPHADTIAAVLNSAATTYGDPQ